jgi:hypothetical protein
MLMVLDKSITYVRPDRAPELDRRSRTMIGADAHTISTVECQKRNVDEQATVEESRSPSAKDETLQRWNNPRRNSFRV